MPSRMKTSIRVLRSPPLTKTGPWRDMASRYAFVDLPGGATFAIWSWAFDGNWVAVDAGDELIRTLRFQRS